MRYTGLLFVAAAMLSGCGGSTGPSNGNNDGSAFDITISGGLNPSYSWPGGDGHSVSIVRVSAPGTIVWGVANPIGPLPSPVTHGSVPSGALPTSSAEARLTAGVRYRVAITRKDTKTGFKEFTP
jgi:hypothetical protein